MGYTEVYRKLFGPDFDPDIPKGIRYLQHTLFFSGLADRLCDHESLFACSAEQVMTRDFTVEAINLIKLAASECQIHGGSMQVCGSELDGLISGNSPSIASARDRMRYHGRYQEHPYNPFRNVPIWTTSQDFMRESFPGQGGMDFKIKGNIADYRRVCTLLQSVCRFTIPVEEQFKYRKEKYLEALKFIYPDIDSLEPVISCQLIQTYPPEKEGLPLLSLQLTIDDLYVEDVEIAKGTRQYKLTTKKRVVAALNITPDTPETAENDNRDHNKCTNLDGLRGQIVLVHKGSNRAVTAEDKQLALDQTEVKIHLPARPNTFEISAEAVEFHREQIVARMPNAADNLLEILTRGVRKRHSYWPIPFLEESIARYQYLTDLLWQYRGDLSDQITGDKSSNELMVGLELDNTVEFLRDLVTTGLWKFLPDTVQYVINPSHINRVIELVKWEIERIDPLCKADAVVQIISELLGGDIFMAPLVQKRELISL